MRRRDIAGLSVAGALLLGGAGCGAARQEEGGTPPAEIQFRNESLDQADVYVVTRSGVQLRLGTVTAGQSERLRVSVGRLGGDPLVNIVARILASGRSPSTGTVTLVSGERLEVTLGAGQQVLTVLPVRTP